ncbi:hypothetical protein TNCV_5013351 [Trichonephila clavipes]|nr:hypothetical protein TNCV_5013351 [Trichonephila clavipes]
MGPVALCLKTSLRRTPIKRQGRILSSRLTLQTSRQASGRLGASTMHHPSALRVLSLIGRLSASDPVRLLEGEERPLITLRVCSLKIRDEPRQILLSPFQYSKLRLTTGVHLAHSYDELGGH